jgi:hypothetical protein
MHPVGRTIVEIRPATPEEMEHHGWEDHRSPPVVLVLDDLSLLIPSQDEEGNGPGAIFIKDKKGDYILTCMEEGVRTR